MLASSLLNSRMRSLLVGVVVSLIAASSAWAVSPPFTENFSTNDSQWGTGQTPSSVRVAPTYNASGGPNGAGDGYISYTKPFTSSNSSQTIFRGQNNFDSSGDAFVGDWVAAGINELSFFIRTANTVPTTVAARLAPVANAPAFSIISPTDIQPNTWTQLTFPISLAASSGWIYEGDPGTMTQEQLYNSILKNLSNVQILAEPESTASPSIRFDLDAVSVVPEPAMLGVLGCAALPALLGRQRHRRRPVTG
jgi:hypothetical protein